VDFEFGFFVKKLEFERQMAKFNFNSKKIPTEAGCYLFFDEKNEILYIGKAKNLRKRVSSYFQKTKKSQKIERLIQKIAKIETRITNSEVESLILERNLIREFRPKFNFLLRDDKNFLYLKITREAFPRMEITRKIVRNGDFYFGPKTSAKGFRATVNFLQKVFGIRSCRVEILDGKVVKNPENRKIPCLDFHVKKCAGACSGEISREEYAVAVRDAKRFLRGRTSEILKNLREKMMKFANERNFEAAAKIRDLISGIEVSTERQSVQFLPNFDADFVNFFRDENSVFFARILFRGGRFIDQNEVEFQARGDGDGEEILEQFLTQFYEKVDEIPAEIFLPKFPSGRENLEKFLSKNLENPTKISVPTRGDKKKIVEMAEKSAKNFAERSKIEKMSASENFSRAIPELAEILNLKKLRRVECFDVSHFFGRQTVASQVVAVDGRPARGEYRKFRVKSLAEGKIDDFAAMAEVLGRRFKNLAKSEPKNEIEDGSGDSATEKREKSVPKIPDLIVLDGGKGQLSAVMKLFSRGEVRAPDGFDPELQIIALAKREEEIFRPGVADSIKLPLNSPALQFLQRIRDEAHRFAITFQKKSREKSATKSVLDEIPGIGVATKRKLLKKFGSARGVREASDAELREVLNSRQISELRERV